MSGYYDDNDNWIELGGGDNDSGYALPGSSTPTNVDAVQPGGASGSGLQVGVRTGTAETGYQTLNKDGSITYQDPDGSVYTKMPSGAYTGGSDSSAWTYNPTTGTSSYNPTPSSMWDSISNQLKGLYSTNGQVDIAKVAPIVAGLAAAAKSNTRTQQAGYQGGIPKYTATRQAPLPGQKLSGNVTYTPKAAGGSLATGGFIVPADVVSHAGNGSSDAGLKFLAQRLGAQPIRGHGDGMSDSIHTTIDGQEPARVANEEAYISPEHVARIGGGDARRGAQRLREVMADLREARTGSTEQGKQIDPSHYMPGGAVKSYVAGDSVGTTAPSGSAVASGMTGTESNLSNWAGPYVTDMLGKGQALSEMPYEQYTGPLTAGASTLQTQAFNTASQNAANPYTAVGKTFTADQAQQYMNPYLKAALDPQMAELQRQAGIKRTEDAARLTKAGGYGGGRQAIMESEGARNLLDLQRKTLGEGYSTAYDKAMQQFNADQNRQVQEAQFGTTAGQQSLKTLAELGATQRGIEAEDVAAQKKQFEEARENPYKMVQFQQSLLSGLPLAAQTYNLSDTNNLAQFAAGLATLKQTLDSLGIKSPAATTTPTTP